MSWIDIVILAVVQGIAEFLPISSSGHLVVVTELLGREPATDLNVVLHAGTLLSILVYFRSRIVALLSSDYRVVPLLIVGSIPAAALGLWIKRSHEGLLENGLLTGLMLVVTGLFLLGTRGFDGEGRDYRNLKPSGSFLIGLFQALALLPGISRSGATIFGGLIAGLDRHSAATFSFLLAIPAIGGATVLEVADLMQGAEKSASPLMLAVGCLIAFVVGLVALRWLFQWIEGGKLHYFAYWCIPFGLAVVVWQLLG